MEMTVKYQNNSNVLFFNLKIEKQTFI